MLFAGGGFLDKDMLRICTKVGLAHYWNRETLEVSPYNFPVPRYCTVENRTCPLHEDDVSVN